MSFNEKTDHVDDYFGTRIADPYRWLEDDRSPATAAWVEAQNRKAFAHLDRIPFRAAVRERVRALADHPKHGVPFRSGGRILFFLNDGLRNQPVLYVQAGLDAEAEVLLDPNALSADGTVALASFTPSGDGRFAACELTAIPGSDWHRIRVLELETRRFLDETIEWVRF